MKKSKRQLENIDNWRIENAAGAGLRHRRSIMDKFQAFNRTRRRLVRGHDPKKASHFEKIADNYLAMDMIKEARTALHLARSLDTKNAGILLKLVKLEFNDKYFSAAREHAMWLSALNKIQGQYYLGLIEFRLAESASKRRKEESTFPAANPRWGKDREMSHLRRAQDYLNWVIKNQKKDTPRNVLATTHCRLATISRILASMKGMTLSDSPAKIELYHLEQSLKFDPKNPVTLFELGMHYGRAGEFKKAQKFLRIALENDPKDPASIQIQLAFTMTDIGDHKTALKLLTEIIKDGRTKTFDTINAHAEKARLLAKLDKLDNAIETLNDALLTEPDNRRLLRLKSDFQMDSENFTGGYETNRTLSQLATDVKEENFALLQMAYAQKRRKKWKESLKLINQVITKDKTNFPAHSDKIQLFQERNQIQKAVNHADFVSKIDGIPKAALLDFTLKKATLLLQMKKYEEAEKILNDLKKVNQLSKEYPYVRHGLLDALFNLTIETKTNKKHHKMLESFCKKIIKTSNATAKYFKDQPVHLGALKHDEITCHKFLNWLNAIDNKTKEFLKSKEKIKRLENAHLKDGNKENFNFHRIEESMIQYNYACAFAIAGNKLFAEKCLTLADKLDPTRSWKKVAKKDADFLNIYK